MKHKNIKVIFSINTGRSGSAYVASLFKGFSNVESFHEPNPALCGKEMKEYQLGNKNSFDTKIKKKLALINNTLTAGKKYFESNHYFINGFGNEIIKHFSHKELGILIIKRDPEAIINSYFLNNVSIIGRGAFNHLLHPFYKDANKPFYKNKFVFWIKLSLFRLITIIYNIPFYLTIRKEKRFVLFEKFQKKYLKWFIDEYEFLKNNFIINHPNITYVTIDINSMNEEEILKKVSLEFGFKDFSPVTVTKNTTKERKLKHA